MPRSKRAKPNAPLPESSSTPDMSAQAAAPSDMQTSLTGQQPTTYRNCTATCCQTDSRAAHLRALDRYTNGPCVDGLLDRGGWETLATMVIVQAGTVRKLGLARWEDLTPETREKLSSWSPAARQLWESDFLAHHEAMVRAWIWHYLDDNLFSFAGGAQGQSLVALSSPVWEHFRAFRRDLNVLLHDPKGPDDHLYRIQFYAWSRMTEHLVRKGLGEEDSIKAADLVPHYKKHLRLILQDGDDKIPDDAHDGDLRWRFGDIEDTPGGPPHHQIRQLIEAALIAQYYVHGVYPGSHTLRFSPIGSDSIFGFPVDEEWMKLTYPVEIPYYRPGSEEMPPVQLVSDPMLVVSGVDGLSYDRKFTRHAPMRVVAPWTFGGKEAAPFVYPGFEKGWEQVQARHAERIEAMLKKAGGEGAADLTDNSEASQTTQDHAADEGETEDQADSSKD
ncbi:uncharacterized protein B0H64DRAFT_433529 [Chaetomium fimeti]|uniref:Uncharacterized protein n=1 Tax=Chaetomium fimeti TaxID=1854472 RepID=A0AAE0LR21_9PEZI|nr:hypothetical protein B0H64DRAFT_433529 [Chaetomium fimeti]